MKVRAADDIYTLVIGRERDAVGERQLVGTYDHIHLTAGVSAIDIHRKLTLQISDFHRLAEMRLEATCIVGRPSCGIRRALIERIAVRRIGEPDASIGMRSEIVGRIEPLAVIGIGDHRHRAVVFVAHHAPRQVLAAQLAALEIEAVAVAVVRRHAVDADVPVLLQPAKSGGCWGCRSKPDTVPGCSMPAPPTTNHQSKCARSTCCPRGIC